MIQILMIKYIKQSVSHKVPIIDSLQGSIQTKNVMVFRSLCVGNFLFSQNHYCGNPININQSHPSILQQDYQRWAEQWNRSQHIESEQKLKESLYSAFFYDFVCGKVLYFAAIQCKSVIPLLTFLVFENIQAGTYHSNRCLIWVIGLCLSILAKGILFKLSSDINDLLGLRMSSCMAQALIRKTLKLTSSSGRQYSPSDLSKLMHIHVEKLLVYPDNSAAFYSSIYNIFWVAFTIVYICGWIGVATSAIFFVAFFFRLWIIRALRRKDVLLNQATEKRVKKTIEVFSMIKYVKVNALQETFLMELIELRKSELQCLDGRFTLQLLDTFVSNVLTRINIVIIYVLSMVSGQDFSAAILFGIYLTFRYSGVASLVDSAFYLSQGDIAFSKLQAFLSTEDQASFTNLLTNNVEPQTAIFISNGQFWWGVQDEADLLPEPSLEDVNLSIRQGSLVAIVGNIGSGKSSLLNALLGQIRSGDSSIFRMKGKISYASQKPWILNDTVKQNILFGQQYNEVRYLEAIRFSCLEPDLKIFEKGDRTVIGQRGCTVSGGQKARIALARALYFKADILLLDDILSAVDAHVGSFIFKRTILEYLKGKTILLVTHCLHYASLADHIVFMQEGKIKSQGTYEQLVEKYHIQPSEHIMSLTAPLFRKSQKSLSSRVEQQDNEKCEERSPQLQQNLSEVNQFPSDMSLFGLYMKRNGGWKMVIGSIVAVLVYSCGMVILGFWIKYWVNSPNKQDSYYCYVYLLIVVFCAIVVAFATRLLQISSLYLAVYQDMMVSLLYTDLCFFQRTPLARIINRLAKDLIMSDKILANNYSKWLTFISFVAGMLQSIFVIFIVMDQYMVLIMYLFYMVLYVLVYYPFASCCLHMFHLVQELKVPLNSCFSEIINGAPVIRAYKKVGFMIQKGCEHIFNFCNTKTANNKIFRTMELINVLFASFLYICVFTLLSFKYTDTKAEILLIYSMITAEPVLKSANKGLFEFMMKLKYLGRCEELTRIDSERGYQELVACLKAQQQGNITFPYREKDFHIQQGAVRLQNLSIKYKSQLGLVIKDVSLQVKPGEKIGIVGRTGSGKSTLLLSLLRLIEPCSGSMTIDNADISKLSLEALRSSISIILQENFFFAGTLRQNMDPSHEHMDSQIIRVLDMTGVWESFRTDQGLQSQITEEGANLSAGECQMLSIARAMLSKRKIVLMDEATSNIDAESDNRVQQVLREQFSECTVLTVAHRIHTVLNSDQVLVLQQGQVAEFDTPERLKESPRSLFAQLLAQSRQ